MKADPPLEWFQRGSVPAPAGLIAWEHAKEKHAMSQQSATARPELEAAGSLLLPDCPITDADLSEVRFIREGMLAGGYKPLVVNSPWSNAIFPAGRGKAPMGKGWQHGHPQRRLLRDDDRDGWARAGANTGLLLGVPDWHVQAFDIDIDDSGVVGEVCRLLEGVVPFDALVRSRPGSVRMVLLARCVEGAAKLKIHGSRGGFERLAHGQQVVVHGWHAAGGKLAWQPGRAPWEVPAADLPLVSEKAVAGLMDRLQERGVLGSKVDRPMPARWAGNGNIRDENSIAASIRNMVELHDGILHGIPAAIAAAGSAGGYRHDTLVSCAGYMVARGWPVDAATSVLLPACDESFGDGSWAAEVDAALAHAVKRQKERIREVFNRGAEAAEWGL